MADGEARSWDEVRAAAIEAVRRATAGARWPTSDAEEVADAVLAVLDEEALSRLGAEYVRESRLRSLRAEDGSIVMDMVAARDAAAGWVLAARAMLANAPNYSETSMEFTDRPRGERYAFTVQRVGKLTPHEARQRAEQALAEVRAYAEHPSTHEPARDALRAILEAVSG